MQLLQLKWQMLHSDEYIHKDAKCVIFILSCSCLTARWTIRKLWGWPERWMAHRPEQRGGCQMVCVLAKSLWPSSITRTLTSRSYESLTGQSLRPSQTLRKSIRNVAPSLLCYSSSISSFYAIYTICKWVLSWRVSQCLQSSVCCGPRLAQPGALCTRKRSLCWEQLY